MGEGAQTSALSISALRVASAEVRPQDPEVVTTRSSALLLLVFVGSHVFSNCSPCASHKL